MVADIDRLVPETATELSDVRYGRRIQRPERVFVECFNAFRQRDFDAIRQQVVLTQQILLLDSSKKNGIVRFPDRHSTACRLLQTDVLSGPPNTVFRDQVGLRRVPEGEADPLLAQIALRDRLSTGALQELREGGVHCEVGLELFPCRHNEFNGIPMLPGSQLAARLSFALPDSCAGYDGMQRWAHTGVFSLSTSS
jgi:hypothetical protein